jgi:hypothetical protein
MNVCRTLKLFYSFNRKAKQNNNDAIDLKRDHPDLSVIPSDNIKKYVSS